MSPHEAGAADAVTTTHLAVVLLSLLSCLTTSLGVVLALVLRESARAIAVGIGFSAGIMVLISLVELLPEAIAGLGTATALASAILGATLIWVANLVIPHTHFVAEKGRGIDTALIRSAYLVVFGLILHDVPEGFAMANAYVASPRLGVLVALTIALHNLPEEFAMALPALTVRSGRFLLGAALLSALAEPFGAIIGLVAVGIAPWLNAGFLALAAGAMLFVSTHELIPMARRYGHTRLFLLGIAGAAALHRLLAAVILP
jgi:ZIP family zinc transporter